MLIVEGMDGVGKTTLVDYFVSNGMKKYHFDYDVKNMDLMTKYMRILKEDTGSLVLDRSFISEMVYGPVLRGKSKIDLEEYTKLLMAYKQVDTSIIYLTASKETLIARRLSDISDYNTIMQYYDLLNKQYDSIMDRLYKISSALNKKDNNELVNEWKELKKEITPLWKANIYKNELDKRQTDNKKINNKPPLNTEGVKPIKNI